jgi:hypothetical protein
MSKTPDSDLEKVGRELGAVLNRPAAPLPARMRAQGDGVEEFGRKILLSLTDGPPLRRLGSPLGVPPLPLRAQF